MSSPTSQVIYCFLNGPYLGGAERSFVLQARDLKSQNLKNEFVFFLPFLDDLRETKKLSSFIITQGFRDSQIRYFRYSPTLYKLSRTSGYKTFLWFVQVLFGLIITIRNLSRLDISPPDVWWVGGNKVGFVVYLLGILSGFKGRFLWHFRDYPFDEGIYKLIWKLFKLPHHFSLEAIGNSYDVSRALNRFGHYFKEVHVLYNPVGKISFHSNEQDVRLGTASMMAPWKGVQSLIVFALIYEQKLRALGIKEFEVYGDEIYKTSGSHQGYMESLKRLVSKANSSFVSFKGLCPPEDIFKDLDIFVHGALKPEPFGRVVVEAYHGGAAVVSTGLGGSGELVDDNISGFIFKPYDYEGLFQIIEELTTEKRFEIIQNGKEKALKIQETYEKQLSEVF